jgi:hypothetical protein
MSINNKEVAALFMIMGTAFAIFQSIFDCKTLDIFVTTLFVRSLVYGTIMNLLGDILGDYGLFIICTVFSSIPLWFFLHIK